MSEKKEEANMAAVENDKLLSKFVPRFVLTPTEVALREDLKECGKLSSRLKSKDGLNNNLFLTLKLSKLLSLAFISAGSVCITLTIFEMMAYFTIPAMVVFTIASALIFSALVKAENRLSDITDKKFRDANTAHFEFDLLKKQEKAPERVTDDQIKEKYGVTAEKYNQVRKQVNHLYSMMTLHFSEKTQYEFDFFIQKSEKGVEFHTFTANKTLMHYYVIETIQEYFDTKSLRLVNFTYDLHDGMIKDIRDSILDKIKKDLKSEAERLEGKKVLDAKELNVHLNETLLEKVKNRVEESNKKDVDHQDNIQLKHSAWVEHVKATRAEENRGVKLW